MITICKGDARDIASIMPVMNSAFPTEFGEAWTANQCIGALAMSGCHLRIAKIESAVVGFSISRRTLDEEELLLIAVDSNSQNLSVGSQLLKSAVQDSFDNGVTKFFLEVRENNDAFRFYEKHGFEIVGIRPNYYRGADGVQFAARTMAKFSR